MRLFYALWPDAQVREHLAGAAAALRLGCDVRRIPCGNFHVTLKFIGEIAASHLPVLRRIGDAQRALECTVTFDAYEFWPEPHVVAVVARESPAALVELSTQLHRALSLSGAVPPNERPLRPLRPHVTLARKVAQAPVLEALSPIPWNVRSFSLVSSDTSAVQSVYTVVDTWPLLYEKPQS
ncbi:MAG: RNA 2',3'-cyclic phosphodiesterase [Steroidobacteraceae bacterium]